MSYFTEYAEYIHLPQIKNIYDKTSSVLIETQQSC